MRRPKFGAKKYKYSIRNDELAIKNLKRLFKYEVLKNQEYAECRAMMAQASST